MAFTSHGAQALNRLRTTEDVFALCQLLRRPGLQIPRLYLARNNVDTRAAHLRGSPAEDAPKWFLSPAVRRAGLLRL
jgi:hypothetical protein